MPDSGDFEWDPFGTLHAALWIGGGQWAGKSTVANLIAARHALTAYHFAEAARLIYEFTWSEFCDWYVEMSKGRLREEAGRAVAQRVLIGVLDGVLRLVHPIMPFVAESIWPNHAYPDDRGINTLTGADSTASSRIAHSIREWLKRGAHSVRTQRHLREWPSRTPAPQRLRIRERPARPSGRPGLG